MNKSPLLWYTRKNGIVNGPFSPSLIKNSLLLQRLNVQKDEVSNDKINWTAIAHIALFSTDDNQHHDRSAAWRLDERNGFDRRYPENKSSTQQRRNNDRRSLESIQTIKQRQYHTLLMDKFRQRKPALFWPLTLLFICVALLLLMSIKYSTPLPISQVDCSQTAQAGVNWSNCLKARIDLHNKNLSNSTLRNSQLIGSDLSYSLFVNTDLAYSDLRFTNLSHSDFNHALLLGANLANANLSYANLSHADLSYVDLTNANLTGSKRDHVRFDHAIWTNGQLCLAGSIGQCVQK